MRPGQVFNIEHGICGPSSVLLLSLPHSPSSSYQRIIWRFGMFPHHGCWVQPIGPDEVCHLHFCCPMSLDLGCATRHDMSQERNTLKHASPLPKIYATQEGGFFGRNAGLQTIAKGSNGLESSGNGHLSLDCPHPPPLLISQRCRDVDLQ